MGDHSLGVMWVFQAAASNSSDPIDSFRSPEDQGAKSMHAQTIQGWDNEA